MLGTSGVAVTGCSSEVDEWMGSTSQAVVSCDGIAAYQAGTAYAAGAEVQHHGSLYECKPWPASGWCQSAGYEPGVSLYWQDAWTFVDVCESNTGGSGGGASGGSSSGGAGTGGALGGSGGSAPALPSDVERILSFEAPTTDWTPGSGALVAEIESGLDGMRALVLGGPPTWTTLTSAPMAWPGVEALTTLGFDLRIATPSPEPGWWGHVLLRIESASGQFVQTIGTQTLDATALDRFRRIEFQLNPAVVSFLASPRPDLRFVFEVNRPEGIEAFHFDRLSFSEEPQQPVLDNAPSESIDRILSFESLADWATSAGTATLGTDASDLEYSLELAGTTYVDITNRTRLSSLVEVSDVATLDVKLPADEPNPYWHGHVGLSIHLPSQGLYWQWIGSASLDDLSPGVWGKVQFSLPADIIEALEDEYSDLQFKISLNGPAATGTYEIDRLDFGQPRLPAPDDQQRIHIVLPVGTTLANVAIAPSGVATEYSTTRISPGGVSLVGTNLRTLSGGWADVVDRPWINMGIVIDAGSDVGDVWSSTGVRLGDATIHGHARTRAPTGYFDPIMPVAFNAPIGDVLGNTYTNQRMSWADVAGWTVAPAPGGSSPPEDGAVSPGDYGALVVGSDATVVLSAGEYSFRGINVHFGGTLRIDNRNGPVVIRNDGPFGMAPTSSTLEVLDRETNNVAFIHLSKNPVTINHGSWFGLILAPHAFVESGPSGGALRGAIYAKGIRLTGVNVTHHPFSRPECGAVAQSCGRLFGCEVVDTDRDSLPDCEEERDDSPWTDPGEFNGISTSNGFDADACPNMRSACESLDERDELEACMDDDLYDHIDQYAGWDLSVVAVSGCARGYAFAPHFNDCIANVSYGFPHAYSGWGIESKGYVFFERSGRQCFRIDGLTEGCGSLFLDQAETASQTFDDGTVCYDVEAGAHPISWAFSFNLAPPHTTSAPEGFHVRYCYGGEEDCTATDAIPPGMLRPRYDGEPLECPPGTCLPGCNCEAGTPCTDSCGLDSNLTCGSNNGAAFGLSSDTNVCWENGCAESPAETGCGSLEAPCGICPSGPIECESALECPAGYECGTNNAWHFGLGDGNVCWPTECAGPDRENLCGDTSQPCGRCSCTPTCSGKTCGDDPSDGCGGFCARLCAPEPRETGCLSNLDCGEGEVCVNGPTYSYCSLPGCALANPGDAYCDGPLGESCDRCTICDAACEALRDARADIRRPFSEVPGSAAGSFEVTKAGSGVYSVPLVVPPGRSGFAPEITLTYSDETGDGPLGVGWSIGGFSQINRCPRTKALDGEAASVSFDDQDAFCLDGQRLVQVGAAANGWKEYRTAVESFARVRAAQGADGPSHFEVWTRDGRISEYGTSEDSSIAVMGRPNAKWLWAVSRVRDRSGNAIHFSYLPLLGELLPRRVSYEPDRSISFEYERRDEDEGSAVRVVPFFSAGQIGRRTHRIKTIEVSTSERVTRRYHVEYGRDESSVSEVSSAQPVRIQSVAECVENGSAEECFAPTVFNYETLRTVEPVMLEAISGIELDRDEAPPFVLDANGDGRDDFVSVRRLTDSGVAVYQYRLLVSTGEAEHPFEHVASWLGRPGLGLPCFGPHGVVDIDRDGRDEIVDTCPEYGQGSQSQFGYSVYELQSNSELSTTRVSIPYSRAQIVFVDLDGDGFRDRLQLPSGQPARLGIYDPESRIFGSAAAPSGLPNSASELLFIDVDGDGVANLVRAASRSEYYDNGVWRTASLGISNRFSLLAARFGDFNGDGLTDIWHFGQTPDSPPRLWSNTGSRFVPENWAESVPLARLARSVAVDVDGDGAQELVQIDQDGLRVVRPANNWERAEELLEVRILPALNRTVSRVMAADFSGDGSPDFLVQDSEGRLTLIPTNLGRAGRLKTVEDGLGKVVEFGRNGRGITSDNNCETGGARCLARRGVVVTQARTGQRASSGDVLWRESKSIEYHNFRGAAGRGSFGPQRRTVRVFDDEDRVFSTTVETFENTDWRMAGVLLTNVTTSGVLGEGSALRRRVRLQSAWQVLESDEGRPFAAPTTSLKTEFLVSGIGLESSVSSVSTTYQVNTQGQLQQRTRVHRNLQTVPASTTEREVLEVEYEYQSNAEFLAAWLRHLPSSVTVTGTRGGRERRRQTLFEFSPITGLLEAEERVGTISQTRRTEYARDEHGNVTAQVVLGVDEESLSEEILYDSAGLFPVASTNAAGHVSTIEFDDATGRVLSTTDPNGLETNFLWDAWGRFSGQDGWQGSLRTEYTFAGDEPWNGNGIVETAQLAKVRQTTTFADGGVHETDYDSLNRSIMSRFRGLNENWVTEATEYDWAGRPSRRAARHAEESTAPGEIVYEYDGWGRVSEIEYPDETFVEIEYLSRTQGLHANWWNSDDASSAVALSKRTPRGSTAEIDKVVVRDAIGNVVSTVDAAGTRSAYYYEPFSNLARVDHVVGASGSESSYTYDDWGRAVSSQTPERGLQTVAYNAFDEPVEHGDPRGLVVRYDRDSLGRVTSRRVVDGPDQRVDTWTFDVGPMSLGRLSSATSADGHSINYDYYGLEDPSAGRLKSRTTNIAGEEFSVGFSYDEFGRLEKTSYPEVAGESFSVSQLYDSAGHLASVRGSWNEMTTTAPAIWEMEDSFEGQLVSRYRLGNDVSVERDFEATTGRLRNITATGTEEVLDVEYQYLSNGNVASRHDKILRPGVEGREVFDYDEVDRLVSIVRNGMSISSLSYDPKGNILSKDGRSYSYRQTNPDLLESVSEGGAAVVTLQHDEVGNEVFREGALVSGGSQEINYTFAGLPRSVRRGDGHETEFEYGPLDERLVKRSASTEIYSIDGLYERVESEGTITHKFFVFAGGERVAQIVRTTTASDVTTATYYFLNDALGSVAAIADEEGNVVHRQDFEPFGASRSPDFNAPGVRFGFTGHVHDEDLGLIDMNGRVYDPMLGRFITADPFVQESFDLSSYNRYAYVRNNPLIYTDSTGLFLDDLVDWIFGGSSSDDGGLGFGSTGTILNSLWSECVSAIEQGFASGFGTGPWSNGTSFSASGAGSPGGIIPSEWDGARYDAEQGEWEVLSRGVRPGIGQDFGHGWGNGGPGQMPGGPGYNQVLDDVQEILDYAGLALTFSPLGIGIDIVNVGISVARGDFRGAAYRSLAVVPLFGDAMSAAVKGSKGATSGLGSGALDTTFDILATTKKTGPVAKNSAEQAALIDMAKLDKKLGVSADDAAAYAELGSQVRVPVRGPEVHPGRPHGSSPHIHVGPIDHIPVIGLK